MRNPNFKKNLTIAVSLVIVVFVIFLNIRAAMRFSDFTHYLVMDKLEANVNSLERIFEESKVNTRSAAISMSQRADVINAVREQDAEELLRIFGDNIELYAIHYYTVTDSEGTVLARTHEPEIYGDSIANQHNISDALNGVSSTYLETGTVVRISIRSGAPVYDTDGELIGVISAGIRFDTNETADMLKNSLGVEVTVFLSNLRVATTLHNEGERITGTILSPELAEILLGQGQEFVGELQVLGTIYETYYRPLFDPDGNVFAIIFLGIPIDDLVNESNRLMYEVVVIGVLGVVISLILINALRNMMNADKAKNSFFSTMSHEIRTPMNAILGITEIQLLSGDLQPDTRTALEKIYASGDMLLGIINDILDLSKIEAGKLEVIADEYELASLISDTAQLNMMRIGSKPIEFELVVDENTPVRVRGDEIRVKQILNNLLSNAFKYTSEGKVTLSVSARENVIYGSYEGKVIDPDDIILVFTVSDTGQGMTKHQVAKLFDEYARFNMSTNRKTEGTGLGMSITRNLIKLMGGEIFVESTPGQGSKFTVHLPQGRTCDDVLGSEMVKNLHKFRGSNRALMKRLQISREPMPYGSVLVVDDVETNIYVASGLMLPYGLKIDSADSGQGAISKIERGKVYDVIFMDHMMPNMDGVEAVKHIRDMGYTAPIIALTANAIAGQADMFLENGFDDFISKPIDVRQLNTALNKWVRDKQPPEVREKAKREFKPEEEQAQQAGPAPSDNNALQAGSRIASAFVRDANKSIPVLETAVAKQGEMSTDELRSFVIHVHGLKGALAAIGNQELSESARKLEMAGRESDFSVIASDTPAFLDNLKDLLSGLSPEEQPQQGGDITLSDADTALLREKLLTVKSACDNFDVKLADTTIKELRAMSLPKPIEDTVAKISEYLLHSDFDEAGVLAEKVAEE